MANINPYEPVAKARVATAMSASLTFCAERKYLQDIDSENSPFKIRPLTNSAVLEARWISIKQVGRPVEKGPENCFVAIQKILYSCFIPKKSNCFSWLLAMERNATCIWG